MNDDTHSIRNQIIITDSYTIYCLKGYSDIELAAIYSKNKNNLIIFEKLLLKINKNEQTINELLFLIIKYINEQSSIDAIKLLIKHGTDVNYGGNPHWTSPIYCCLNYENIQLIELLIENGADVNINCDYSPLIHFVRKSSIDNILEITKLLIRKGSKINYKDEYGETALIKCFKKKCDELIKFNIIKLLLDNKLDIYIKNNDGENILKIIQDKIGILAIKNYDIYSLIFNYKNLKNDHFCEYDINFIYYNINFI